MEKLSRAERRRREREAKKKVTLTYQELQDIQAKAVEDAANFKIECIAVAMAVAERRLYGFGKGRLSKTFNEVLNVVSEISEGKKTLEEFRQELYTETGYSIKLKEE